MEIIRDMEEKLWNRNMNQYKRQNDIGSTQVNNRKEIDMKYAWR